MPDVLRDIEPCNLIVDLPKFWPECPTLFFKKLEAIFYISAITDDSAKYNYVICTLDSKDISKAADIVLDPPATNKYEYIKTELIRRFEISNESRMQQLTRQKLGDRSPTQFLSHLRALAIRTVDDNLLRPLWFTRLPSHVQDILLCQMDTPLDQVAILADRILEVIPVVPSPVPSDNTSTTSEKIEDLSKQMELEVELEPKDNDDEPTPETEEKKDSLCWYHKAYGVNAHRCLEPCSWVGKEKEEQESSEHE